MDEEQREITPISVDDGSPVGNLADGFSAVRESEEQSPERTGRREGQSSAAEEGGGKSPEQGGGVKRASLKTSTVYNLISKLLTFLIPVITTPYLARVLGETGNGQISYVSSIITYFILGAGLGFSVYGQREIAKCRDNKEVKSRTFWEIFVTKTVTSLVALAVLAAMLFTVGFGEKYNGLMMIMALQVIAVIFDIEYLYMGEENFRTIAIRNILVKLAGLVLIFAFVRSKDDVWIYALYLSCSVLFSYLIMWLGIKKYVTAVPVGTLRPWRHLGGAFVVFLPMVITSLFTTFDKTMIGLLSPNADYDNGCYEQAYKINSVAQTFITVFSSVMISRNAYEYRRGNIDVMNEHIYMTGRYVWFTSVFFVAGFMVLSDNFSSWFLGEGYVEVPLLYRIMCVRLMASGFSIVLGDRFISMGREKSWMIAVAFGAVSNIVINYFMIPVYGAVGAAVATAICEAVILLVMIIMTIIGGGLSVAKLFLPGWRYLIAGGLMGGIMYLMQYFMGYSVWTFLAIGIVGTVVYGGALILMRDGFVIWLLKTAIGKARSLTVRRK